MAKVPITTILGIVDFPDAGLSRSVSSVGAGLAYLYWYRLSNRFPQPTVLTTHTHTHYGENNPAGIREIGRSDARNFGRDMDGRPSDAVLGGLIPVS